MNAKSLKPGWRVVKFGDVVKNSNLTERDPHEAGIDRVVGLEHIDPGNLHIKRWNSAAEGTSFTRKFVPGQTLFGKRRAYQRKVAFAEFEGICSGDILTFESKDPKTLLPELLPFICQSDRFFDHALGTSAGSLSPRTSWKALASFEFPLPPIDEQKRMAEILWAADDAVEQNEEVMGHLQRGFRKILFHAFQSRAGQGFRGLSRPNTSDWQIKRVNEVGKVQLGRQRAPRYQSGKHKRPYLRVANVFDDFIKTGDVLSMDFDDREFAKYRLEYGDVLLNEGQSRELVGRCAMYTGQVDECCYQNTLLRFRAGPDMLPEFALLYFQFLFYRGSFASVATQTTSIAHLGAETLKKLYMPVPSRSDQETIVQRLRVMKDSRRHLSDHSSRLTTTQRVLVDEMLEGRSDV